MAGRTVVWTKTAKIQRRSTLRYWKEKNHSSGFPKKIIKNIDAKIAVLLKHPESSLPTNLANTRMSAMGHFSIFYKLD